MRWLWRLLGALALHPTRAGLAARAARPDLPRAGNAAGGRHVSIPGAAGVLAPAAAVLPPAAAGPQYAPRAWRIA